MARQMKMTTFWWDRGQLQQLRALAALETLKAGRRVSISELVRSTVWEHLLKGHPGLPAITKMTEKN